MSLPPRTRGDCASVARPCPHGACRYHLGSQARESCALDVADRGGVTLGEIGELLGVTVEGARQIELRALGTVARRLRARGAL